MYFGVVFLLFFVCVMVFFTFFFFSVDVFIIDLMTGEFLFCFGCVNYVICDFV